MIIIGTSITHNSKSTDTYHKQFEHQINMGDHSTKEGTPIAKQVTNII